MRAARYSAATGPLEKRPAYGGLGGNWFPLSAAALPGSERLSPNAYSDWNEPAPARAGAISNNARTRPAVIRFILSSLDRRFRIDCPHGWRRRHGTGRGNGRANRRVPRKGNRA